MKKYFLIALVFAIVGIGAVALFFAPLFLLHHSIHTKTDVVHNPDEIENALLALRQQKSDATHLIFRISRQPNSGWHWFGSWTSVGGGFSWTQGDREIEFSKVGDDMIAYSIPIRWRQDSAGGEVVSEIETNVAPSATGSETYSTPEQEYKKLSDYLTAKTPDAHLHCTIGEDANGRIVNDIEYLDGSLSLPQGEWGSFVMNLFKTVYESKEPIYMDRVSVDLIQIK